MFKRLITVVAITILLVGCATSQQEQKTPQQYLQAAKAGDPKMQDAVGIFYFNGIQGFPKDEKKSTYWFAQAAKQGFNRSQFNLGVNYQNGYGVQQDKRKALYWFEKAAANGHPKAKQLVPKLRQQIGNKSQPASKAASAQKTGIFDKDSALSQAYTDVVIGQQVITKCPQLLSKAEREAYSTSGQRAAAYLVKVISIAEETENVEPYFKPSLQRSYATYQVLKDQPCTAKDIKSALANGQEGLKTLKDVAFTMSDIRL